MTIFETMTVPTPTEINKNFVIKYRRYGEPNNGKFNRLIGAGKYEEKFGSFYMEKHFTRAIESGQQRIVFGIRGKYVIIFNSK